MVLHDTDEDLVALLEDSPVAVSYQIKAFSGISGENDLLGTLCADEAGDNLAGLFEDFCSLLGQVIESPQRIRVLALIKPADSLDHAGRLLTCRRVVQIDKGGFLKEYREIIPDICRVHDHPPYLLISAVDLSKQIFD